MLRNVETPTIKRILLIFGRRLGVRVPHGAPNKKSSSQKGSFYLRAYKQRDSNPKGPLRPRECPVDIRSAACPSMHSMRRTPYAQHTGKSLMARQIKRVLHRRALFICVHINKGTRTRKGRCVRENVRWTFDQQRVQACTACAGRRMRSIRASPSWRAK